MSEEKKPVEETTEPSVNTEKAYDPEYQVWKARQKTESRLKDMVEKDPDFKEVLDAEIDGVKYRDEILAKPKILDDEDLFVAKTKLYSRAKIEQLKKTGDEGKPQEKPAAVKTDDGTERPARREDTAPKREDKWSPRDLTDEELKAKGYKDKDIVMLRTFS